MLNIYSKSLDLLYRGMKLFSTAGGKMKKLLFVLFTIAIATMCFGELNLSEKKMILDTPCPGGEIIAVEDINGDGFKDGIVSSHVRGFYTPHDGSLYAITNMNADNVSYNYVEILPEDSIDGYIFKCSTPANGILRLWERSTYQSSNLFYQDVNLANHTVTQSIPVSDYAYFVLEGDLNNDGVTESILKMWRGFKIYSNDDNFTLQHEFSYLGSPSISLGNYNQDSLTDIFLLLDYEVAVLRNDGDIQFTYRTIQEPFEFTESEIFFADVDGDSDTDIIEFGSYDSIEGYIKCHINNQSSFSTSTYQTFQLSTISNGNYISCHSFKDINGDMLADLCMISGSQFYFILNNNGTFDFTNISSSPVGDFKDINSDNLLDIVHPETNRIISVNCSTNDSVSFTDTQISYNAYQYYENIEYILGDINNDNIPDMILKSVGGDSSFVLHSDASYHYTKTSLKRELPRPEQQIMVADLAMDNNNSIIFSSTSDYFYGISSFDNPDNNISIERLTDRIPLSESSDFPGHSGYGRTGFYFDDLNNDNHLDLLYFSFYYWHDPGYTGCKTTLLYAFHEQSPNLTYEQFSSLGSVYEEGSRESQNLRSVNNFSTIGITDFDFNGNQELIKESQWYDLSFDNNGCTISDSFAMSLLTHRELASGIFELLI